MPFTPFHMGPGLMVKALLQGSFSLMVFGWAQIMMDIQPLARRPGALLADQLAGRHPALHKLCLYSGLIGACLFFAISHWLGRRHRRVKAEEA